MFFFFFSLSSELICVDSWNPFGFGFIVFNPQNLGQGGGLNLWVSHCLSVSFFPLLELKDQPWHPQTCAHVFSCSVSGRVNTSLRSLTRTLRVQERERGSWSEKHRLVILTLFLLPLGLSFRET